MLTASHALHLFTQTDNSSTNRSTAHRPPFAEPATGFAAHWGNFLVHNHPLYKVQAATPKTVVVEVPVAVVAKTVVAVVEPAMEELAVAAEAGLVVEMSDFDLVIASSVHRFALDMAGSATQ